MAEFKEFEKIRIKLEFSIMDIVALCNMIKFVEDNDYTTEEDYSLFKVIKNQLENL